MMNYTELYNKFRAGKVLTDEELKRLNRGSCDIVAALNGKGCLVNTLLDHSLTVYNRTRDIIEARGLTHE